MLGDIVALVHNDLEHEDFEYYLLVVTDSPTDAGDTMGGLFLEPQSGKSGIEPCQTTRTGSTVGPIMQLEQSGNRTKGTIGKWENTHSLRKYVQTILN